MKPRTVIGLVQTIRFFLPACTVALAPCAALAQPSGGPYGPVQRTYDVPNDAAQVFYVSPDAQGDASGKTPDEPTTLETAIARVATGDAIILRGGTYRTGGLKVNQGITLQPYGAERPILKDVILPKGFPDPFVGIRALLA